VDLGASVLYTEEELAAALLWAAHNWKAATAAAASNAHTNAAVQAAVGTPSFQLQVAAAAADCPADGCVFASLHVAHADLRSLRATWKALHPAGQAAYHLGVHDCLLAPSRVSVDSATRPRLWPGPAFWSPPSADKGGGKISSKCRTPSDASLTGAVAATDGTTPWGGAALPPGAVEAALAALKAGVLAVGTESAPRAIAAAAQALGLQNGASYAVLLAEALAAQQLQLAGPSAETALLQLCMQGCPAAARQHMWWRLLRCPSPQEATAWMQTLQAAAASSACPLAPLFGGDAEATGDDEAFFPFEGGLADMAAALCYDASVAQHCAVQPHHWVAPARGSGELLPPSGVLPYEQLSSLAAPLTLVCPQDTTAMYFLWRHMVSASLLSRCQPSHTRAPLCSTAPTGAGWGPWMAAPAACCPSSKPANTWCTCMHRDCVLHSQRWGRLWVFWCNLCCVLGV